MKPKKWDTRRYAVYGAFAGAAITLLQIWPNASAELSWWAYAGRIFGGAVGGALVVAALSGFRNLMVR